MSCQISSGLPEYFQKRLGRRNWISAPLEVDFIVGDCAVLRLTSKDLKAKLPSTLRQKIQKFVELPMRRIVIIEGAVEHLVLRRSKTSFSLEFSIDKYLSLSELLRLLVVRYGVTVVQTFDPAMTLSLICDLEREELEDPFINFFIFESEYPDIPREKYYRIVTYLSAHYGIPFQELSSEQICRGLQEVKIPGVGQKTVERVCRRLNLS